MKKIVFKRFIVFIFFLCNIMVVSAQDKTDTVFMTNGEKREGKVVAVNNDAIKFLYKGETLEYVFQKTEISKIVFASGRTEVMNNTASITTVSTSAGIDRRGKIAVLPFAFISNDSSLNVDAMGQQLQTDSYNSIRENTNGLQLQDPITTNSLLAKEGLTNSNIKSKTPQEMALLLGVEYVVYGIANVTNKGTSSYGSGSSTYKGKETEQKNDTKSSGTVYSSSSATTLTNYDTKIDLSFYNDQGVSIYSESRNSFGSGFDAYHATINYLVKRCPFGTKAKH